MGSIKNVPHVKLTYIQKIKHLFSINVTTLDVPQHSVPNASDRNIKTGKVSTKNGSSFLLIQSLKRKMFKNIETLK